MATIPNFYAPIHCEVPPGDVPTAIPELSQRGVTWATKDSKSPGLASLLAPHCYLLSLFGGASRLTTFFFISMTLVALCFRWLPPRCPPTPCCCF